MADFSVQYSKSMNPKGEMMVRKCLVLTMLVMLLMPLAGVNAQSDMEGIDYCQIIPEPDCQILVKSEAVMAEVSSFAFNMDMSLHLLPDSEEDSWHILLTGGGRVAVGPEALGAANSMTAMTSADADAMAAMLDSLFAGTEGEVSLLLTSTTTDETGAEAVDRLPINLVMENGVYAMDLASLVEASGESMEGSGWLGINLTGAAQSMKEDPEFAFMFDMESGMMDTDYGDLAETMTITRLPDSEVNGVAVAVFETAIDGSALLDMMLMPMMAGMTADMEMDRAEMDAEMESLQDATILVREHIGLEDFYAYRTDVFMDANIAAADTDESSAESLFVSFSLGVDLSDFNAPVDVEIPADVTILPYAMLMQMSASN